MTSFVVRLFIVLVIVGVAAWCALFAPGLGFLLAVALFLIGLAKFALDDAARSIERGYREARRGRR